ncbi:MAG: AAA family ATPase [Lachnospiraceae bacterium]|nr:AAA family ATPase [Lachnospiraceae bacterium]
MNKGTKKLPVGVEDFKEIRTGDYYYVDKTGLVAELIERRGKVNLFTRPRRFGKSLNISMLQYFFEYGCDPMLFNGLQIMQDKEICKKYMGKFPVVSVSLKDVDANCYKTARGLLCVIIGREATKFQFLMESDKLTSQEKARYQKLINAGKLDEPDFPMPDEVLISSLRTLTELLYKHYSEQIILLIDEYDVPLDKAQQSGYYDDMVTLIRTLFGQALKTNPNLYFAVLTGCLRIAKESIFTGLNSLKVFSVTNVQYGEQFGFSDREVREMLEYYGFDKKYELIKAWYDGYHFGDMDIYCPWDVINYIDLLHVEPDASPYAFWVNTSGNEIIKKFLQKASAGTKRELEQLIAGKSVYKKINQELTYWDLYKNIDNLWSVLFTTGYLTQCNRINGDIFELVIPNLEIRQIFIDQIMEWFQEEMGKDTPLIDAFCDAFIRGDAEAVEEQFNAYLLKTISIRDTNVRKGKKENFYHGILLGLLSHREDWWVRSNVESGDGFSDILVECEEKGIGIVIEVKYPDGRDLEEECKIALKQIERMGYETKLKQDGMERILRYGIACNRKKCKVLMEN